MNFNDFMNTPSDLGIEISEVSSFSKDWKRFTNVDFIFKKIKGMYTKVDNSTTPNWELIWKDSYISSDLCDNVPLMEEDKQFMYAAAATFGVPSFPVLLSKTGETVIVNIETVDNIPPSSPHNILNATKAFIKKYTSGSVYISGNVVYYNDEENKDKYIYNCGAYPPITSSEAGYSTSSWLEGQARYSTDMECYIFPEWNYAVFGPEAKNLLINVIGVDALRKSVLNKAFIDGYINVYGSKLPDNIDFKKIMEERIV